MFYAFITWRWNKFTRSDPEKIIHSGVEKVFINSAAIENLEFIS